ncbi:hypothetical protein ACRAWD_16665 [Caulobacter segnis]
MERDGEWSVCAERLEDVDRSAIKSRKFHDHVVEPQNQRPTHGRRRGLIDPADAAVLLLDHQSGLFQTVKDIAVADLRRNVEMVARLATLLNIPVITTASEPTGSNGPLMPEIHQLAARRLCAAQG